MLLGIYSFDTKVSLICPNFIRHQRAGWTQKHHAKYFCDELQVFFGSGFHQRSAGVEAITDLHTLEDAGLNGTLFVHQN